jgi:hypothetical protein
MGLRPVVFVTVVTMLWSPCTFAGDPESPSIIEVLQTGPDQVTFDQVKAWRGQGDAYYSLRGFLLNDPSDGSDWRKAIVAIAIVAGGDQKLGKEALADLKRFAKSTSYYGSDQELPKSPYINEAAMAAKYEVPIAISMLANSSMHGTHSAWAARQEIFNEAKQFLLERKTPGSWSDVSWQRTPLRGETSASSVRNKIFADHTAIALSRLSQ